MGGDEDGLNDGFSSGMGRQTLISWRSLHSSTENGTFDGAGGDFNHHSFGGDTSFGGQFSGARRLCGCSQGFSFNTAWTLPATNVYSSYTFNMYALAYQSMHLYLHVPMIDIPSCQPYHHERPPLPLSQLLRDVFSRHHS